MYKQGLSYLIPNESEVINFHNILTVVSILNFIITTVLSPLFNIAALISAIPITITAIQITAFINKLASKTRAMMEGTQASMKSVSGIPKSVQILDLKVLFTFFIILKYFLERRKQDFSNDLPVNNLIELMEVEPNPISNESNFGFHSEDSVDEVQPLQQARPFQGDSDEWMTKDPINYKTYEKKRQGPVKKLRRKFVPLRSVTIADESEITLDENSTKTPGQRMSHKRKQSFPRDSTQPQQYDFIVRKLPNKHSVAAGTTMRSNPPEVATSSLRISSAVSTSEIVTLRMENKSLKMMISTFLNEAKDMQEVLNSWTDRFNKMVENDNLQESEGNGSLQQQTSAEPRESESTTTEAPPRNMEDPILQVLNGFEAEQKEITEVESAKSLSEPQPLQVTSTSAGPLQLQPQPKLGNFNVVQPNDQQPGSRSRSPAVLQFGAVAGALKKISLTPYKTFKFPHLPIASLEVFSKFNEDLANKEYFVFASKAHQDRCLAASKSSTSPIDVLRNLIVTRRHPKLRGGCSELMLMLKDLVSVDLLKHFVYDKKLDITEERLELKCYKQFVEFFRVQAKQILKLHVLASLHFLQTRIPLEKIEPFTRTRELPTRINPNARPQPSTSASAAKSVVIASKDDIDEVLKKYFTEESVLELDASEDDDDDVQDVTPAPISIDIVDDSD